MALQGTLSPRALTPTHRRDPRSRGSWLASSSQNLLKALRGSLNRKSLSMTQRLIVNETEHLKQRFHLYYI